MFSVSFAKAGKREKQMANRLLLLPVSQERRVFMAGLKRIFADDKWDQESISWEWLEGVGNRTFTPLLPDSKWWYSYSFCGCIINDQCCLVLRKVDIVNCFFRFYEKMRKQCVKNPFSLVYTLLGKKGEEERNIGNRRDFADSGLFVRV